MGPGLGKALGQGGGLKNGGPSGIAEAVVWCLLPPAAREHVVGDLHERYVSPRQYFLDAASVVPCVILSRIRRTTDPAVLLMEALVLYLSFFAAAWYKGPAEFLSQQNGLVRLAIPTAVALLAFRLVDAYANPKRRWALKPVLQAALGMGFAFLSQATLVANRDWTVPFPIMLIGSAMGLLLISAIRMLFAAGDHRPTGTG